MKRGKRNTPYSKPSVTLHSNAGKCAFGSRYCTQFPEFAELFVLKSRTESDARKKDSVIFVLISRTNFSRNFVRVLCATVRDFSAVIMQSNSGRKKELRKGEYGALAYLSKECGGEAFSEGGCPELT
jgi:hypothetical protein